MAFHQKVFVSSEKRVRCFYCFEEKHEENYMHPQNLQRHSDRYHQGRKKQIASEEYIEQKRQEEIRLNEELENMRVQREELERIQEEEERQRADELERAKLLQQEEERLLKEAEKRAYEEEERRRKEAEEVERKITEELVSTNTLQELLEFDVVDERFKNLGNQNMELQSEFLTLKEFRNTDNAHSSASLEWLSNNKQTGYDVENQLQQMISVRDNTEVHEGNKKDQVGTYIDIDINEENTTCVDYQQKPFKRLRTNDCINAACSSTNPIKSTNTCVLKSDLDSWGAKLLDEVKAAITKNASEQQVQQKNNEKAESDYVVDKDKIALIRSSTSMTDLIRHSQDFSYNNNLLVCNPCKINNEDKLNCKLGSFKCEFTEKDNFENTNQPRAFCNLKTRVIEHLNTPTHKKSKGLEEFNIQLNKEAVNKNYHAGMNVARNAYKCIKLHDSYAQFESEIQIDAAKGVEIGELNHSSNFAKEMTEHFYTTLKEQHKEIMKIPLEGTGKPRPFSIVSDKGTPNRTSLHIIGMISQMDNKLQPVLLDVVEAQDGTGVGLAKDLYDSMKTYFTDEEIKSRLVSTSWDGQYFTCNVDRELMNILKVPEEDRKFYAPQWDISHIIELADKDAKDNTQWVKSTYDVVANLNQQFGHGKSFMELNKKCDEHNEHKEDTEAKKVCKRMKPFSKTRFATYTGNVIEAARNNYDLVYDSLHAARDPTLSNISNAGFVLRLNGLRDMYQTIGETSREVQKPDAYSWHLDKSVQDCSNRLERMAISLEAQEFDPNNNHLKYFNQAVREIRDKGTFMSKPLTNNKQSTKYLRSQDDDPDYIDSNLDDKIQTVGKELAGHIRNFKTRLEIRYNSNKAEMCLLDKNCFSMDEVLKRSEDCIPRHFKELVDISQRTNYISPSISLDALQTEYHNFAKIVHQKAEQWKGNFLDLPVDERKIYDQLLNTEADLRKSRNVGQLLAGATTRTSCEAVTEGMGSVIKKQVNDRKSLTTERLAKEAYICWNGPFPGKEANILLERSLDKKFGLRENWHFYRKTKRADKIKDYDTSKVVDRATQKTGKVPFNSKK